MSDAAKAVFLSYASQDAEAAKKICDALRAAGVEVWFDQSELVGGDAWDQKIRKQIRECALLIPIISAATQARTEGYFRLEWRLADQRTHLMGRAKAFLLPVCIDDTKDADADVPDSFSAVQWTRLPAGEGATAFAEQVKKLLSAEVAPVSDRRFGSAPQTNTGQRPVPHSPGVNKWWWVLPIFGVTMALLLVLKEGRKEPAPGVRPPIEMPAAAPLDPKVAEARALVAKAQPLHENLDSNTRADYELAEQMFKRAIELAPLDAEVWAHYSWFGNNYVGGGLDRTPARLAEVKQAADRALKLDPKSDMALFSWGNYYRREPASLDEAVRVLQELVVRRPDFLVARRVLALGLSNQKKYDEALAAADYVSAHDPGDTRTWITRFGILLAMGRPIAEAEAVLDASLAIKPTPRALVRKALLLTDRGDMAGAAAILARVPPAFQQDDRAVLVGVMVALAQRQPARVREILALFPRDYMEETNFPQSNQPKAMALGFAAWIEGKPELARLEWQQALHVVDERLATHRTDGRLHYLKTLLHAMLGQEKEAEAAFRLYAQITPSFNGSLRGLIELWLGRQEKVLDVMETWTLAPAALARLRADPAWAPLWGNPRFEALKANAVEPPAAPSSLSLSPSTLSAADSKSVAVLPFANLSGDPAQEYFSDGLTEEILSALTNEKDLRVPGRTSAFAFKGRTITAPEIARALNVAQVVEGSVRKSGNQVRITVTLTRASDGFSEPLGIFTERLNDIFALQEKVARAVVEKLTKRTATAAGVVVLTKNPEAYDLYLKALAERRNPEAGSRSSLDKQERLLQAAVALDPNFAAGWAELAVVHADRYNNGSDRSADRLALVKAAIDKAFQLAPDTPEAISAMGRYYLISASDYVSATEQFEKRVRLQPGNAEGYYELAVVQRRQGHWAAALTGFQKAAELDPGNSSAMRSGIIRLLEGGRRYEEAARWQRRLVALQPDSAADGFNLAYLPFKASGSTREMEAFLAGLKNEPESVSRRRNWAAVQGHLAEAIGLRRQRNPDDAQRNPAAALDFAILLAASGDRPGARAVLAEHPAALRSRLEREPDNSAVTARLAQMEALLGHADEALRVAQKAMELTPESVNPWDNTSQRAALAFVYAWTGDKDRAIAEYAKLLRSVAPGSGQQNVYEMKHHPAYLPLQDDPKFEALLNDPKNNQPLF